MLPPKAAEHQEARLHLSAPDRPLEGYSILVVDDQMTTAMDLERLLRDRGAASVTIVGTAAKAMDIIVDDPPDVAILDVDLGDDTSIEIANELARLSVPFIFAANEIDATLIPHRHRDVQVTSKPYSGDAVAELLKEALLPHLIRAVLGRLV
jgi:CheY-like chemotaxis protein